MQASLAQWHREAPDMKAYLLDNPLTHNVRDFARQIWLAGLGAFARAQDEGGKFFETLVQEGQAVDARMKKTAGEKIELGEIEIVKGRVEEIRERATGAWNKLEEVFQARVARALSRLGVPSRDDIQQLFQQIELLSQNIHELTQAAEAETKAKKVRAIRSVEPAAAGITEPVA
jgi:poly(hydroxyalkanoate) granule-associated protein